MFFYQSLLSSKNTEGSSCDIEEASNMTNYSFSLKAIDIKNRPISECGSTQSLIDWLIVIGRWLIPISCLSIAFNVRRA